MSFQLFLPKKRNPRRIGIFGVVQMVKNLPAMLETQIRTLGWEDPLEKRMATHSSIPAWRIPWKAEPGGLQSMGSERVGHDWATELNLFDPTYALLWDFPGGSDGKASTCNTRDPGLIPGLGRFPGEGNGNPLQYSCLENPMDRGA